MKSRFPDDWGNPIGKDYDVVTSPAPKKKPKQSDTLSGLVYDFRDQMLLDTSGKVNAQVNGPAMMKAFRKLLDAGRSYDEIRLMIKQFYKDISAKPLTGGIPAWQAFVGRLDTLWDTVSRQERDYSYDGPKIDPRLVKDEND